MKRQKTRPPQSDSGDIREVWEGIRQSPPAGAGRYQAAEAARVVYDRARRLYRRFPQDANAGNAYIEAQKCYQQLTSEAYPPTLNRDLVRLAEKDPSGLESIVAFLEADPIFYGTGYFKEGLSYLLRDVELPSSYARRLQAVVLSIVDRRDGREFRAFCRLARKVDAPALRDALMARLTADDASVRRRARWVLEALAQKDAQEQVTEKKSRG